MLETEIAQCPPTQALTKKQSRSFLQIPWWIISWASLFCTVVVLYAPALHAGYFSDDFLFFFTAPPPHYYEYFFRIGSAIHAYRPLEAIILTATQQHFQFETMPIHLLALACHAGLACLLISAARKLKLDTAETLVACAVLFCSQVGVSALIGNDTLSQSASALLGWMSILLLWAKGEKARAFSPFCFLCSLFFRETAFGFLLILGVSVAYLSMEQLKWRKRLFHAGIWTAPYVTSVILYLFARHAAGGTLASHGRYGLHFGTNIASNFANFGLAAFSPISTVTSAAAFSAHHKATLAMSVLAAALMAGVTAVGIFLSRRYFLAVLLTVVAAASLFPTFLLEHVSELYLYNAMPAVALVIGLAFGSLFRSGQGSRCIAISCLIFFLGGQMLAVRQKSNLMAENGRHAAQMLAAIKAYLPALPSGSEVDLVRTPTASPNYSVFRLNGFDVLDYGNIQLGAVLGRPDVRVDLVDEERARSLMPNSHLLLLGLNENSAVERYAARKPQDSDSERQ